jgi:tRNA pseudouridine32 synthase/23S rRNA pseudouridine746 synthase
LQDPFFTPFDESAQDYPLPEKFTNPFGYEPNPLCILASEMLQKHIVAQKWNHNFGLKNDPEGEVTGKMFGVLVVQTSENKLGYLSAFSGKIAGTNQHEKFVPPVFDTLEGDSFLTKGMNELKDINQEIKVLKTLNTLENQAKIDFLKEKRKNHSNALQEKLFLHYHFVNQSGESKSLKAIFENTQNPKPAGGAGECAAPKLLQYAFLNQMKPIAMAEFWWGQSPKANERQHRHFYPACQDKCVPILAYMLENIALEEKVL